MRRLCVTGLKGGNFAEESDESDSDKNSGAMVPFYLDLVRFFHGANSNTSDPHHRIHETQQPNNEEPHGNPAIADGKRDGQANHNHWNERKQQEDDTKCS